MSCLPRSTEGYGRPRDQRTCQAQTEQQDQTGRSRKSCVRRFWNLGSWSFVLKNKFSYFLLGKLLGLDSIAFLPVDSGLGY